MLFRIFVCGILWYLFVVTLEAPLLLSLQNKMMHSVFFVDVASTAVSLFSAIFPVVTAHFFFFSI